MKKQLLLLFLSFSFINVVFAQEQFSAYSVSIAFSDQCYNEISKKLTIDDASVNQLHLDYFYPGLNAVQIIIELKKNPFFENFDIVYAATASRIDRVNAISEIGALDVTSFAQGLSQFMIKRAKAELNAAFFERFKKFAEDNDEIGLLFPVTSNRLSNLLSFQYTEMITQLRNAFYEDFNNLPDNMITFLQEGDDFEYLRKNSPDFIIAVEYLKLVRELDYLSPPDFIAQLPDIVTDSTENVASRVNAKERVANFKAVLQLVSIFSESVRDTSKTRNWVSSTDFKKNILDDPITLKIYLGLVYQRIKNKEVEIKGKKLAGEIKNNEDEIRWYTNRLNELIYLVNRVDYSYKEIKSLTEQDKKVGNEQVYSYINTTIEITEFGNKFVERYADYDTYKKFNDYLSITKNANDIYRYVYMAQYSSAVISTSDLLSKILVEDKKPFVNGILKYGTFMANMVEAETPEDVSNIIEAAALPVGSSSIKKNSNLNVAVNGYLGAFARTNTSGLDATNAWNSKWAVSAPVGITVSYGLEKFGSLSLMGVILDVGAIVDYQIQSEDNTIIESKISLGNIFSPGGYFIYGFPFNIPMSLGFGYQYGPGLSSINTDDNTTIVNKPNGRWGVLIAVDIPMFNIWNVSKR